DALTDPGSDAYSDIGLHFFIQYHLHTQLQDATEYAHQQGIIVKGDIAIGVYRYGVDAWQNPSLYHLDFQAGAPPDDFAIKGQNWGFPTYNWDLMRKNEFAWWKQRFAQMSDYFDAFRIDHILGFFRIWSIPMDAVEGIMGHFVPAIPVHISEFNSQGIWFDYKRYVTPYITENVLWKLFGYDNELVKSIFLQKTDHGQYALKPAFATQRLVEAHFETLEQDTHHAKIKQGLYDLISNVILFEETGSQGQEFHFRFGMETTSSFQELGEDTRQQLKQLYVNYFFRRQDDFWKKKALEKLPALKRVTNMLVCGEDLGLVPECVPDVMRQLGLLSLEIQRMPKDPNKQFFHPDDAPYLSVVTPSTHDMSTIRGWWEEDREKIQLFYNQVLGQWGDAPYYCEAWINKAIVVQHLYSSAMWCVFQLQDLLGMNELLRRNDPNEERINVPANPKHYWQYRMHLSLEELLAATDFTEELNGYIAASGRK
ncbi:MAG: 4-alpha-glucanotransferase, partial [Bacteroidota bacterium]|nr:4-alpha-glucanotransferase [Bacteroidota bacterium]